MDRTNAPNSENGFYKDKDVGLGRSGTFLMARDRNLIQEELVQSILASGQALNPNDATQLMKAIKILGNQSRSFRNEFVNPIFVFNRRGGSPYQITGTNLAYTLDQWFCSAGTSGQALVRQINLDPGAADTPASAAFCLELEQTIAGNSAPPYIAQRISRSSAFSGSVVTVSWFARAVSGAPQTITPEIVVNYGIGGSAPVSMLGTPVSIGGTFPAAAASQAFQIPADDGKVFGSRSYIEVRFRTPVQTTPKIQFAAAQLEFGNGGTPIEARSNAVEHILCSAFYQTSYPVGVTPGTVDDSGAITFEQHPDNLTIFGCHRYLLPMLVTPTITWYSPNTLNAPGKISWGGADRNVTNTVNMTTTFTGIPVSQSAPSGVASGKAHFTAEAVL